MKMENKELNQKVKGIPNLPKLRIDIFSKAKDVQDKYLLLLALTFRIKPDIISEMFNYPDNYLFEYVFQSGNTAFFRAINILNTEDGIDQRASIVKLINFYNCYVGALRDKNSELIKTLKRKLNDYDAYELMRSKRELGDKISLSDIKVMIEYRLKFGLTIKNISELFHVSLNGLKKSAKNYLEDKPELKLRWDSLGDYYSDYFLTHGNGRQ